MRDEVGAAPCPSCGKQNAPRSNYCYDCSQLLKDPPVLPALSLLESDTPRISVLALLIAACTLLAVIGIFGTWVRVLVFSVDGVETDDGKLALAIGIAGAVLALLKLARPRVRAFPLLNVLILGAVAALGVYDWQNLANVASDSSGDNPFNVEVEVGWGLIVMTIAAATGAFLSLADGLRSY